MRTGDAYAVGFGLFGLWLGSVLVHRSRNGSPTFEAGAGPDAPLVPTRPTPPPLKDSLLWFCHPQQLFTKQPSP